MVLIYLSQINTIFVISPVLLIWNLQKYVSSYTQLKKKRLGKIKTIRHFGSNIHILKHSLSRKNCDFILPDKYKLEVTVKPG